MTGRPAATQRLCDLARLSRVRDRIDPENAQPLDVAGFPFVLMPRQSHRVEVTHDLRSDQ